jgi:uncharacterized protein YdcH (DUF465 family)
MIEPHDLRHEFPEYAERIHTLKTTDEAFRKLFDEYHDVDKEVRRMETGVENVTDDVLEERKVVRVKLKDALYAMLKKSA